MSNLKLFQDLRKYLYNNRDITKVGDLSLDKFTFEDQENLYALLGTNIIPIHQKELFQQLIRRFEKIMLQKLRPFYPNLFKSGEYFLPVFFTLYFANNRGEIYQSIYDKKSTSTKQDNLSFKYNIIGNADFNKKYMVSGKVSSLKNADFQELFNQNPEDYFSILLYLYIDFFDVFAYKNINSLDEYKRVEAASINESQNTWFRGQAVTTWPLMPSMFRGVRRSKSIIIDNHKLIQWYKEYNVDRKYKKVKGREILINYSDLAYLQHVIGFSPLIDYTSNFVIATIFSFNNYNQFHNFTMEDSSIHVLYQNNTIHKKYDNLDFKVIFMKKSNNWDIRDLRLLYDGLKANVDILLESVSNNDRMEYQQGRFMILNNTLCITDNFNIDLFLSESSMQFSYILNKNCKMEILNYLKKKYPEFLLDNLMNPYAYLNSLVD